MFTTPSEFPSDLADIGLAAAADPRYADRLIAALRLLAQEAQPLANSDEVAPDRHGAAV
jgi:hypothetical protein